MDDWESEFGKRSDIYPAEGYNSSINVDASMRYRLNESLEVSLEGVNLTDEYRDRFTDLAAVFVSVRSPPAALKSNDVTTKPCAHDEGPPVTAGRA